jgi:hypothetical protein
MPLLSTEQLGWNLSNGIAITSSGNYFVFDESGSLYLDFKTIEGDSFTIKRSSSILFSVGDDGNAYIEGDLRVQGTIIGGISGSIVVSPTASHLEERGVATFSPLSFTPTYSSGGFFYSSSGEWYLS